MNTTANKNANKNNVNAKVQKGNKSMKPTNTTTANKNVIVDTTITELLDMVVYHEDEITKSGNAFSKDGCHFYTPNKPVGFIGKNEDGEDHFVKLADNPFSRITSFIAKKWATKRDWIPEYKYKSCKEDWELEDVQSIVALNILNELKCGVDRKYIIGDCFDILDLVYGVSRKSGGNAYANQDVLDILAYNRPCEYRKNELPKKYPKVVEEMDENFITLVDILFMGDFDEIDLLPLDYWSEEEVELFKNVAEIFKNVREEHKFADEKTWRCAELFTLGVPRGTAIARVYGDKLGRKKYRSCEVLYSKHANEVQEWLLDGIAKAKADGVANLDKWENVLERSRMIDQADNLLSYILEHNWLTMDRAQVRLTHRKIVANPAKMIVLLQDVIDKNGGEGDDNIAPTPLETVVEEVAKDEPKDNGYTELSTEDDWVAFLAMV